MGESHSHDQTEDEGEVGRVRSTRIVLDEKAACRGWAEQVYQLQAGGTKELGTWSRHATAHRGEVNKLR